MLNGKCGDDNIAAGFTKYYQKVYQPDFNRIHQVHSLECDLMLMISLMKEGNK